MLFVALQGGAFRLLYFCVTEPESQDVGDRSWVVRGHEFPLTTETSGNLDVVLVEGFCEHMVEV